eukprot:8439311-Ditylum_brightwellii.AAC.1
MEKELLSIVLCFHEFCSALLGADITVHTDHHNLTFCTLNVQQVLHWHIFLEEFAPTFCYCPASLNGQATGGEEIPPSVWCAGCISRFTEVIPPPDEQEVHRAMPSDPTLEDPESFESFLNHPPLEVMPNPITMLNIQQHQFQNLLLNAMRCQYPQQYPVKTIKDRPLICYKERTHDQAGDWKIALPTALVDPVVQWYHFVLGHPGAN